MAIPPIEGERLVGRSVLSEVFASVGVGVLGTGDGKRAIIFRLGGAGAFHE